MGRLNHDLRDWFVQWIFWKVLTLQQDSVQNQLETANFSFFLFKTSLQVEYGTWGVYDTMMTVFMMHISKTHEGDLILKVYDGYINAWMYTRYVNVINSIVIFSNQCFVCIRFFFCCVVAQLGNAKTN